MARASERRSITERTKAGTERRPLASTALSALPWKKSSISTPASAPKNTDLPLREDASPALRVTHRPAREVPRNFRSAWITSLRGGGKGISCLFWGFHAHRGENAA